GAAVAAATADAGLANRRSPHAVRARRQAALLGLPPFPTTTIGSFPQTAEVRRARSEHRSGRLDDAAYRAAMRDEIVRAVREQETLGLDVLVHGEPERNDMVEYFGEQLDGYAFSRFGWVQSYGSRCVKPPILYGDIDRPRPMTVEWIRHAQSLTDRPMKGMLTGPVTMLNWSFVRDDQPRRDTCLQLALAIRKEVLDLEAAGIRIIQIDEAALREGLPLRRPEWRAAIGCAGTSSPAGARGARAATPACSSRWRSARRCSTSRRPASGSSRSTRPRCAKACRCGARSGGRTSTGRGRASASPPTACATRRRCTPTCATRSSTTSSSRSPPWTPTSSRSSRHAPAWSCSTPSSTSTIRTRSGRASTTSTPRTSRPATRSWRWCAGPPGASRPSACGSTPPAG